MERIAGGAGPSGLIHGIVACTRSIYPSSPLTGEGEWSKHRGKLGKHGGKWRKIAHGAGKRLVASERYAAIVGTVDAHNRQEIPEEIYYAPEVLRPK